jgi:hypothetical protein
MVASIFILWAFIVAGVWETKRLSDSEQQNQGQQINGWLTLPSDAFLISHEDMGSTRLTDFLIAVPARDAWEMFRRQLSDPAPVIESDNVGRVTARYENGSFHGLLVINEELSGLTRLTIMESRPSSRDSLADANAAIEKGPASSEASRFLSSESVFLPRDLNRASQSIWRAALKDASEQRDGTATLEHFVIAVAEAPFFLWPINAGDRGSLVSDMRKLLREARLQSANQGAFAAVEPRILIVLSKMAEYTIHEQEDPLITAAAILKGIALEDSELEVVLASRGLSIGVLDEMINAK